MMQKDLVCLMPNILRLPFAELNEIDASTRTKIKSLIAEEIYGHAQSDRDQSRLRPLGRIMQLTGIYEKFRTINGIGLHIYRTDLILNFELFRDIYVILFDPDDPHPTPPRKRLVPGKTFGTLNARGFPVITAPAIGDFRPARPILAARALPFAVPKSFRAAIRVRSASISNTTPSAGLFSKSESCLNDRGQDLTKRYPILRAENRMNRALLAKASLQLIWPKLAGSVSGESEKKPNFVRNRYTMKITLSQCQWSSRPNLNQVIDHEGRQPI